MAFKFPKSERLSSQVVIDELFEDSKSVKAFPLMIKYKHHKFREGSNVQIAISVPKRRVKKAVDRNRIKRQIREAYRLNKGRLLELFKDKEEGLALFLIYYGSEKADYSAIENKIKILLQELENRG